MLLGSIIPILLLLFAPQPLSSAQLPTSIELNIIFPREGGRYAVMNTFPVLFSIQNSSVMYEYGYSFSWFIDPCPACQQTQFGGLGGAYVSAESPPPPDNPHIEINSSLPLGPGEWVFKWFFDIGPACVDDGLFIETWIDNSVSEGQFSFTVADDGPAPTFTSTCPIAAGVVSYSTVATYKVPGGLHTCPVTTSATPAPVPCQATVNASQASSISKVLNLSVIRTSTSTSSTTSSSSSSSSSTSTTSEAISPSGLPSQTSSATGASKTNAAASKRLSMEFLGVAALAGIAVAVV